MFVQTKFQNTGDLHKHDLFSCKPSKIITCLTFKIPIHYLFTSTHFEQSSLH